MASYPLGPADGKASLDSLDDAALVAGLRQGDERAIELVTERYAPGLYRLAFYHLQDAMLAEDLVAEVMTRMLTSVERFVVGRGTFQAWLYRIARNLISDEYRARRRRPQVSLERWLASAPTDEPAATDYGIDRVPDRAALQDGLASLSEEQRLVILLHAVDGWELPQVAQILERTLPSVKGLYYRGVESLRRTLTRGEESQGRAPSLRDWYV